MRNVTVWVLCLVCALSVSPTLVAHSGGPRPAHTGGFKEPTCTRCHTDFQLNEGRVLGGIFNIRGIPRSYEPGKAYRISIVIAQPGQTLWGFQLSSRFSESGKQAGMLSSLNESTQIREEDGVQYIEHSADAGEQLSKHGPIEYDVDWIAPAVNSGIVMFNAAGNAADDSGDPEGDYIFTAGGFSVPIDQFVVEPIKARLEKEATRLSSASRLSQIPIPVDLRRGQAEVLIQHRFLQSLSDSSPGTAFGLDSSANINLGFNYALTERLSLGVARARFDKVVGFNSTFEVKSDRISDWKLSFHGGVEGDQNFKEHYSPYLQAAVSVDAGNFRLYTAPTLILNSRRDSEALLGSHAINPDSNHTLTLGLGVDAMLSHRFSLTWEYLPRMAGFGGFGKIRPSMSGGFVIRSWGHVFSLVVSRSRDLAASKYAVNADHGFALGFNIYRRIN